MKNIPPQLICFSHLRWNFVYQRPQHLMSCLAKTANIFYFEEPVFDAFGEAYLSILPSNGNVTVLVPHLPLKQSHKQNTAITKVLLDEFLKTKDLDDFTFWYYTPMAYEFTSHLNPGLTVYDCMDELSAFKFAPPELPILEDKLLQHSDLVFTGGYSLYQAKKTLHPNIYPFPSSIDKSHFGKARERNIEPADQGLIKGFKLGFYGVIDERFDIKLIDQISRQKPEWQIILIGPVLKIDPVTLPKRKNIHYLGAKSYSELPAYLSGWNVALIPFLLNRSTQFISPTKTPEYLAAGVPVISTAIRDVVNPYGRENLVHIGVDAEDFINAAEFEVRRLDRTAWRYKVDRHLEGNSWQKTVSEMLGLMDETIKKRHIIFKAG
ncbi:glycosyltransferase [Pedobacter sp. HMF7647]|uniref:Glycosyltransferase n=1 Tax=Hufsiella arboris TaxID=2695275 RepID=A0A7K1Y968_9SPHI|nr:glycosyltransferase [Hufsiella arboris]MXV50578.1 glycosyltransferase [Hufsiella arboris]